MLGKREAVKSFWLAEGVVELPSGSGKAVEGEWGEKMAWWGTLLIPNQETVESGREGRVRVC